jgi:hypothetical protein
MAPSKLEEKVVTLTPRDAPKLFTEVLQVLQRGYRAVNALVPRPKVRHVGTINDDDPVLAFRRTEAGRGWVVMRWVLPKSTAYNGEPAASTLGQQGASLAYSITSSARARIVGDSSMPNALAMRRLILRSNLVGRSNGTSPGFAPFRTRSSCAIRCRKASARSGPKDIKPPLATQSGEGKIAGLLLRPTSLMTSAM